MKVPSMEILPMVTCRLSSASVTILGYLTIMGHETLDYTQGGSGVYSDMT